ncbi:hypothetical protein MTO96_023283 [Rhipicephalus appendiculatus]
MHAPECKVPERTSPRCRPKDFDRGRDPQRGSDGCVARGHSCAAAACRDEQKNGDGPYASSLVFAPPRVSGSGYAHLRNGKRFSDLQYSLPISALWLLGETNRKRGNRRS